jgi:hypothetical protein
MDEKPGDPDPLNIFSHPSWRPLLELTREESDRIVMRRVAFKDVLPDPLDEIAEVKQFSKDGSLYTLKTLKVGSCVLTSRTRQDPDVNTVWTLEHLLKDVEDLELFLQVPFPEHASSIDPTPVWEAEEALGEGTSGEGRGFVLMPSSCLYGRVLSAGALRNYEKMIELVEEMNSEL